MSERDGWKHLYLYDGATGRVKNQITRGEWVVRGSSGWTRRTGRSGSRQRYEPGAGSVLRPLLPHQFRRHRPHHLHRGRREPPASRGRPSGEYYVDATGPGSISPPLAELRRTRDQGVVMDLERGDTGGSWGRGGLRPRCSWPRDGTASRTSGGSSSGRRTSTRGRSYPVIEYIYAGPHGFVRPEEFQWTSSRDAGLAELGFIVVQIDGMGTSNRSKAFHDVAWKNLGDAGFPDRILWHEPSPRGTLVRHLPGGDLRHLGRRPERHGRAPLPPRLLPGRRLLCRVPRQPDGQDLVERAVDGLAPRSPLRRLVQHGQRPSPPGTPPADGGRAGHERGSQHPPCRS
jgi:hypothetical protein